MDMCDSIIAWDKSKRCRRLSNRRRQKTERRSTCHSESKDIHKTIIFLGKSRGAPTTRSCGIIPFGPQDVVVGLSQASQHTRTADSMESDGVGAKRRSNRTIQS